MSGQRSKSTSLTVDAMKKSTGVKGHGAKRSALTDREVGQDLPESGASELELDE